MLTQVRASVIGLAAIPWLVVLCASSASAVVEQGCEKYDDLLGKCEFTVEDLPGSPNRADLPAGDVRPPAAPRVCTANHLAPGSSSDTHVIDCETSFGTWSQSRQCYFALKEPQPPTADPVWQGNTEGAIYVCTGADRVGDIPVFDFWAPARPTDVDPAQIAQIAIAQMQLRAIDIATSPGERGYVNVPTWFWAGTPSEASTGPIERTAEAGGVSVTATATLREVVWETGEGSVTCDGPGRPWTESDGDAEPECGWAYRRASVDGPYRITATSHWVVEWAGGGLSGEIPLELTAETQLAVAEVQAIVTT